MSRAPGKREVGWREHGLRSRSASTVRTRRINEVRAIRTQSEARTRVSACRTFAPISCED